MTALHTPMPAELRVALTEAIDSLRRAQPISARAVRRFERRRIALSRRAKQQMMALLKLAASSQSAGRGAWELARDVGFGKEQCRRLPVTDANAAPPGSIVELDGAPAAVRGFGGHFYRGEATGTVTGIYAPV